MTANTKIEGSKVQSKSIPAPFEDQFRANFDPIVPPVQFISTIHGRAAYYLISPNVKEVRDRIVLVHGVQTPAIGLYPLAKALQSSFPNTEFVLLDLWGHGLSDTPDEKHELDLFLTLIDDLLDHLQWKKVKLIGFSFGALVTLAYATFKPDRVQSYILIAPAGLMRFSSLSSDDLAQLRSTALETAWNWTSQWLEGGELIVPSDWKEKVAEGHLVAEAVRRWQIDNHQGHRISVVGIVRDGGVMDSHSYFSNAQRQDKIPSLIILGEKDDICTREDLKEFGFGNIETIANVGHAVVREKVEEVAELIKKTWL